MTEHNFRVVYPIFMKFDWWVDSKYGYNLYMKKTQKKKQSIKLQLSSY